MPLYNMKCNNCNITKEMLFKNFNFENLKCENCGGILKKELSIPNTIMKSHNRHLSTTPTETSKNGVIHRFAHYADRNTGESLGFKPAGVIKENDFH